MHVHFAIVFFLFFFFLLFLLHFFFTFFLYLIDITVKKGREGINHVFHRIRRRIVRTGRVRERGFASEYHKREAEKIHHDERATVNERERERGWRKEEEERRREHDEE